MPGMLNSRMTNLDANPTPTVATFQTGRHTMGTTFSKVSRAPPNVGSHVPRTAFRPGAIIRVPHHVPALPGSNIKTSALTQSKFGDICSKFRPFIVYSCDEETYQALALYTFGDSGTNNVMCKDEYISVKDHRNTCPFERLSKYEPLVTGALGPDVELFNTNSICHLVGTFTFSYSNHVQMEGCLDADSTRQLAQLRNEFDKKTLERALKIKSAAKT